MKIERLSIHNYIAKSPKTYIYEKIDEIRTAADQEEAKPAESPKATELVSETEQPAKIPEPDYIKVADNFLNSLGEDAGIAKGYINIGTYGTQQHKRPAVKITKGMCPTCGIRPRAVSTTGVTKSKCDPCAKEYFREHKRSKSGRRWTSKL